MGRKTVGPQVTIAFPTNLKKRAEEQASQRGISLAELVRLAVERELAGDNATVEAVAGGAVRSALEEAGYEIRKIDSSTTD